LDSEGLESTLESDAHEQAKHTNSNGDNLACDEHEERSHDTPKDKDCTLKLEDKPIPQVAQRLGRPPILKKRVPSHTFEHILDFLPMSASAEVRLKEVNDLKECLFAANSEPGKSFEILQKTFNSYCFTLPTCLLTRLNILDNLQLKRIILLIQYQNKGFFIYAALVTQCTSCLDIQSIQCMENKSFANDLE
jgi:hypothetical protein